MNTQEREDLLRFLEETEKIMAEIVERREQLFRSGLRELIRQAWDEVRPRFGKLREGVTSGVFDDRLEEVGLRGAQLELKMRGFGMALDEFRRSSTLDLLKKLLDWINIILKSLASAIPGGEPIVELKEILEKEIEEE